MNRKDNNYRNMFILGVILFPLGTLTGLFLLWALGFALVLVSLGNRSKWKK